MLEPRDIREVAERIGIPEDGLDLHGRYRAKVRLELLQQGDGRRGKYVLVTSTTPTPLGEGKTTTAIGLSMGLWHRGRRAAVAIRQSSLGPTFGIKGGGAGGGKSRIEPLDQCLIHLNGDFHAVEAANNLLAAFIDEALMRHSRALDPFTINWRRVVDVNDRALRTVVVGLGGRLNGVPRETGFDITAASEVMAILALARDRLDLRRRLGETVVGFDAHGQPVKAEDLQCAGAMAVLLREAVLPNLMQTSEGTPALIHAGPFGNIAHGNSSIIADLIALPRVDYLVTEAGFGADMGAEKFFHIKCAASGLTPDAAVLVTTVQGVKSHSGRFAIVPGRPLPRELVEESLPDVEAGSANLSRQIQNVRLFGVPVVVAINRFPTDTPAEIDRVRELALEAGARGVAVHEAHTRGGEGCVELAAAVEEACGVGADFRPLYGAEDSPRQKIELLATRMYGAEEVYFYPEAERELARYEAAGYGKLPICVAKTHLSLSHDPMLKGAPSGYSFPIRGMRLSAGAGFLYALAGDIMTMPGLPGTPRAAEIDLDEHGRTVGLA